MDGRNELIALVRDSVPGWLPPNIYFDGASGSPGQHALVIGRLRMVVDGHTEICRPFAVDGRDVEGKTAEQVKQLVHLRVIDAALHLKLVVAAFNERPKAEEE